MKKQNNKSIVSVRKFPLFVITIIIAGLIILSFVNAKTFESSTTSSFNTPKSSSFSSSGGVSSYSYTQSYKPGFYTYTDFSTGLWDPLNMREECFARQDFIVQIAPGGCQPMVVRSDILEEQNVPVFCQIDAIKVNPLLDIDSVKNVRLVLREKDSKYIRTVGFHPARAAWRNRETTLNAPFINNIGYAVVVLKREPVEDKMPKFVQANLTAVISYNPENTFGVGNTQYYLPALTDDEWSFNYKKYQFWKGKGYLRLDSLEADRATISVYSDANRRIRTVNLKKGESSKEIYFPGFYCRAGMEVFLDDVALSKRSAKIYVDDDELTVYENERFLDDNCRVKKITSYEFGGGKVEIVCKNKNLNLELKPRKFSLLTKDGNEKNPEIGEIIEIEGENKTYLAFYGKFPKENSEFAEKDYAVFFKSSITKKEFDEKRISEIIAQTTNRGNNAKNLDEFTKALNEAVSKRIEDNSKYAVYVKVADTNDDSIGTFKVPKQVSEEPDYSAGFGEYGKAFESYFLNAIDSYKDVAFRYGNERENEFSDKSVGEYAFLQADELAKKVKKQRTRINLLQEFLDRYPTSNSSEYIESQIEEIRSIDSQKADSTIELFGMPHTIRLASINNAEDSFVKIIVNENNVKKELTLKENDSVTGLRFNNRVSLDDFNENSATFSYSCKQNETGQEKKGRSIKIETGEEHFIEDCGTNIFVQKISLTRVAKVRIVPKAYNTQTEANFTVKIGIEKRAIKLSPEKTREMISRLNETVQKWEKLSNSLGAIIKTMKATCFATAAVLTIKNLFQNFGGKSIARQNIMRSQGGWFEKCENAMATGELNGVKVNYANVDDCLRKNSDQIDKDVDITYDNIKRINNRIKEMESDVSSTRFATKVVNTEKSAKKNIEYLKQKYSAQEYQTISVKGKQGEKSEEIRAADIISQLDESSWDNNRVNYEQMRKIELYMEKLSENNAQKSPVLMNIANNELYTTFKSLKESLQQEKDVSETAKLLGISAQQIGDYTDKSTINMPYAGTRLGDIKSKIGNTDKINNLPDSTPVAIVTAAGTRYLYVLRSEGNLFQKEKVYELDSDGAQLKIKEQASNAPKINFQKFDSASYKNPYKNPKVKYHETEPYKGMPAVVPFDRKNGWYAATRQTLPSFGNLKPFQESGRVSSFWLCNVGSNGMEQFNGGLGDDICTQINLDTGQPLDQFPGLSKQEAEKKVREAVQALEQVASQYAAGVKKVRILGDDFEVGPPAINVIGSKCQDFMSPKDCQLMFNVCDPVICPASRCNLGGKYNVGDVVQSGIVGSIFLCLPNYREGIVVPVCLTGIKAGIDGLISILKASRDCLQESLDTGRNVGICDEIKSIYLCELLWREISPMVNIIIPKLAEIVYGQGTRGGGEYLSVTNAWQTTQKSVSYFTNFYAVNAIKAFKVRSTEEVGTEVCKAWVSVKYPNKFKALIEPDSPVQFHAWFQEVPYTDVTIPARSQYKVYYHIYAGKDTGTNFAVYLRKPTETSFYETSLSMTVAYGYVTKGEYASETRDILAPAGYKELCVRTNLQEECGFKQVSSSFAINYIRDKYIQEQATEKIIAEKQCVSGSSSLYPMVNPNLQAGAEESAFPEIYKRGLIRVCSTKNPGETTNPERWKDVGYCDDEKIRCWLDTRSVQDAITPGNVGILNKTLEEIENLSLSSLLDKEGMLSSEQAKEVITTINSKVLDFESYTEKSKQRKENLDLAKINEEVKSLVSEIENITERVVYNNQKAQLLLKKAKIYDITAVAIFEKYIDGKTPSITAGAGTTERTGGTAGATEITEIKPENAGDEITEEPEGIGSLVIDKDGRVYKRTDNTAMPWDEMQKENGKLIELEYLYSWDEIPKPIYEYKETTTNEITAKTTPTSAQETTSAKFSALIVDKNDKEIKETKLSDDIFVKINTDEKCNGFKIDIYDDQMPWYSLFNIFNFGDTKISSLETAIPIKQEINYFIKNKLKDDNVKNFYASVICNLNGKSADTQHVKIIKDTSTSSSAGSGTTASPETSSTDSLNDSDDFLENHQGIRATTFWVGEYIEKDSKIVTDNRKSAFDENWLANFGGEDAPYEHKSSKDFGKGYYCTYNFTPKQNPFYVALPCAVHLEEYDYEKHSWVEVKYGENVCYGQLEDVGPWYTDDCDYVFKNERPKAESGGKAAIDLSPALTYCLTNNFQINQEGFSWRFVDEGNIPDGEWFNWKDDC